MIKKQKKLSYLLMSITTLCCGNYYVADKCKAMNLTNDNYNLTNYSSYFIDKSKTVDDIKNYFDNIGFDYDDFAIFVDPNGNTPMHLAVESNDLEKVNFVLDKMNGQKMLNLKNSDGFDPLDSVLASVPCENFDYQMNQKSEIIKTLVEKGNYDFNRKKIVLGQEIDCTIFHFSFAFGINTDALLAMLNRGGELCGIIKIKKTEENYENYDISGFLRKSIANLKKTLNNGFYKEPNLASSMATLVKRLEKNLNFFEICEKEKDAEDRRKRESKLNENFIDSFFYKLLFNSAYDH